MIAGIILAAGASRRMGSPKALLEHRGETFVNRLVRVFSLVCDPVIVALGYHEPAIRPAVSGRVLFAVNPQPERGQLSSLQTALGMVPDSADGFLFSPVDCPAVLELTVTGIVQRFMGRDPASLLVIPRYRGERGHPVCCSRELIREFLLEAPTGEARAVVRRHVPETLYIDVDDAGVLSDIDDREAYRKLVESTQ